MKIILCIFTILFTFSSCKTHKQIIENYNSIISTHRKEYKQEFLKNTQGPLKKEDFKHLKFYKADIAYQCDCVFEKTPDSKAFEMSTYSGKTKPFKKYGFAR